MLGNRWNKYLMDFAISCNEIAQISWAQHPSPCPFASMEGLLGDFGRCFKLVRSGPSLLICRRICCTSFMLSLEVSRSGHGQQQLAVSRRSGWLPLSPWQKQRKKLSGCGKPHKKAGRGFFSGAWITEHPPTKFICWINARCRTGCIRRGRKEWFKEFPWHFWEQSRLCPSRKGLLTLLQAEIYATAPAGYQ